VEDVDTGALAALDARGLVHPSGCTLPRGERGDPGDPGDQGVERRGCCAFPCLLWARKSSGRRSLRVEDARAECPRTVATVGRVPAGRYAPSPTGRLHLGNLRTALLAWLFARSSGSRFLVRVEDVGSGRSRQRFVTEQLTDLAVLGLDWDGPVSRQSERSALYAEALESRSHHRTWPA